MAKFLKSGKWKKGIAMGLSLSMAAVLSLGIFSACKTAEENNEEEEDSAAMPADTQLLKNGNFEFYSEMTKDEKDLRAILNTPTSWSFSSGSPSSDTKSGLIDLKYWDSITSSSYTYTSVSDAYTNWDKGSIYDKLNFFWKCNNSKNDDEYKPFKEAYDALANSSDEKKFFNEHSFSSVDFEDVQYLRDELGIGDDKQVVLHGDNAAEEKKQEERGILMIHNRRTSDDAVGTAQSYSSSTTITVPAGAAAEISVWVKTAKLRHYYANLKDDGDTLDGLEVTSNAGAYIGVTQTVGGTTLDQMQIKNINTAITNRENENNGWEQYTVYVHASTFATTTVKLTLGLGQGNTDDRYATVNGYALFDDATCKIIDASTYEKNLKENGVTSDYTSTLDSNKEDKLYDATELNGTQKAFAIDLYAGFEDYTLNIPDGNIGLTQEKSGNSIYTSERIDKSLSDNRGIAPNDQTDTTVRSIARLISLNDIQEETTNGYLRSIAAKDFKNYPFATTDNRYTDNILLLLSTNGAAYTAKSEKISLDADKRMLISFFVKTSEVLSGRSGATITLVDGENKTSISAFDSTTLKTVDIDDETKDIYDGWTQCFFFVSNDTDDTLEFSLEFSIGPTAIASSNKYAYGQGYAAFANFQTQTLSKTELSYASTNDRAKKVSLTGIVEDTTFFDDADQVKNIENGFGTPVNFKGVLAGSRMLVPGEEGGKDNVAGETLKNEYGIITGLLNYKHVGNYQDILGGNTETTWKSFFQDSLGKTALQPLVIKNTKDEATSSYGYFAGATTLAASSYQKISLRVKLSAGAKATVYLTDTSEFGSYNSFLKLNTPKVTYWYDKDGNICKSDPTAKGYKPATGIAFELQKNGLYRKADSTDTTYYANLQNYKEKDGNLVTSSDTIAYYGKGDGTYWAYRTEKADGTFSYSTEVKDLFQNGGQEIARYNYTETSFPESKITVDNTEGTNATDWITVTFYVHTGNEAKNYRLEVWAGERDNTEDGIPAGGYVFFDRYTASSISNYDTLLKDAVADLEDDDDMALEDNGNLPEEYAYYYTFTYYDSINYLRYDVNEDEDGVGNLYASYDQSTYSEELIYLVYDDADGERTGSPSYIRFINYSTIDKTVTPDSPAADNNTGSNESDREPISTGDILIIVSSSLLGVIIIFVIIMLIIRRLASKRRRTSRPAAVKDLRYKPAKKKAPEAEPETEEEENPFVKNRKAKEAKAEAEAPAEEAEEETEAPAEEPAEETEETPAEEPEETTEAPAEEPEEPAEEPAEEPQEEPAEEAEEAPAEEATEAPTEEPAPTEPTEDSKDE